MPLNQQEWSIIDRFKEPSSWNALATIPATLGFVVPGPVATAIGFVGAGICVLLGFILKEGTAQ